MADAVDRFLATFDDPGAIAVRHYPAGTRTAADAAAAIGCDVAQIVKSLVFAADGEAVLVLTSGANRVDTGKVARSATGFAIGGTPPFGHPSPLPTLLDRDLLTHDEVWAAAGSPDSVFPLTPTLLLERTEATVADVAE